MTIGGDAVIGSTRCPHCDVDLVRCVAEVADTGTVGVVWLCGCRPTEADIEALEAARVTSGRATDLSPSELMRRKGM